MAQTTGERLAALEERAHARDIEMRDMKATISGLDDKLDAILAKLHLLQSAEDQRLGAVKLGKFLAGTGIFGAIGMAALTFWHLITGKGPG